LLAKGDFQKALDYLNTNEKFFGMILDKRKLVVKALYKSGDIAGCINELLGIIRDNYRNVGAF
jgi:hypothetical protein